MNIKEAKTEIKNTLRVYQRKDERGRYRFPLVRQRPILLIGPPGIGKTAIMEQIAAECGVGFVSYTMTHHTRQSAVGLPRIEKKWYGGEETAVTEYTMSEIIASVYECMERTGKREGILFLDEINCVSETLAPAMLQLLQNKTFGTHKVPEGWMIVAAGNPPEYNKSVREFDIVTLDRVRKIDVEEDVSVWLSYARSRGVHSAILSYLSIKKDRFYLAREADGEPCFVTARGWEDLSELIKGYEELQISVTEKVVRQYLQDEKTAKDFAAYYQLYQKNGEDYGICELLEKSVPGEIFRKKAELAKAGGFEERFTVVNLLLDALNACFFEYDKMNQRITQLHRSLQHLRTVFEKASDLKVMDQFLEKQRQSLEVKEKAELITAKEAETESWVTDQIAAYRLLLAKEHVRDTEKGFARIRELFSENVREREKLVEAIKGRLDRAFQWILQCFGEEQEMVLFVAGLTENDRAAAFISENGCRPYMVYSEKLLYRRREKELIDACERLLE